MKLDVHAFALTCGLVWGIGLFVLTWWIIAFDGASTDPTLLGSIYRGYSITPVGSVIGLIWGLVDGFIGGTIFAWLYNLLASRRSSTQA
ncbi:MAG: bacteriophage holin [Betaproteobacteria bacterium]|nr:MAG: bacteriophage holin [Betaproteobacteria bacterium]